MTETEFVESLPEAERAPLIGFFAVRDAISQTRDCYSKLLCQIENRRCGCWLAALGAIRAWEQANGREFPEALNDSD